MSERFRLNCKRLLMGAACGLAMLVLASGQARAGTLEIVISEGGTTYDILDGSPLDINMGMNAITVQGGAIGNPGPLVFPDFVVVGLNATTNNPGMDNPTGATLIVGGEIQRSTAGGAATLTITVTDTDYMLPAGSKAITSLMSGGYTNTTAGDTQKFTSWFNPNNLPSAKQIPSPVSMYMSSGVGLNGPPGTPTPPIPVGSASTYGLTNETVLTMAGAPAGVVPDIVFGGSTKILGTAIPEPASLAIMLPALPVVIMGWFRHRKARATS